MKNVNFEPKFQQLSKFLDFAKFHLSKIQSGQKCQFWAKFSRRLKISGFSQISSFAGPEWSNSQFKPNFHRDWKFLNFAKLHPSHVLSGQKCQFWAKFSTWLKYFSILPNLSLPRSRVVKNVNFDPNLKRNWKFLDFAKFHLLQAEWSKMSILSQIFNLTQNVCILPNFSLSRSRIVRPMSILIQILTGTKNFRILPDFQISSLARSRVIKFLSHFLRSQIFKTTQNF